MRFELDPADLAPIVKAVVTELRAQEAEAAEKVNGRLAYTESEAATLLGIKKYQLRDARLRAEIAGVKCGKGWLYSADELKRFLTQG